ncbi:MAG: O-antigen ligase family protein [candidate division Zixibacteria bacterium]|nr:O-antigen ligase family protein [candidate division Zixibacteria bacterium]
MIAVTLVAIPFIYTEHSVDPVLMPRLVALSVAVLIISITQLVAMRWSRRDAPPLEGRVILIALAGYGLTVALSLTQAGNVAEGVLETARVALMAALVILFAVVLSREPGAFGLLAQSLTVVAAAIAVIGLCQYYEVAFEGYVRNGGIANRNLLASALCLMLPFMIVVNLQGGAVWRWITTVAGTLSVAVVMLSNSRATWFALVVAGVATLVVWWINVRKKHPAAKSRSIRRRFGVAAIVVAVATAALFATPYVRHSNQESVMSRAASTTSFSAGSVAERLAMWQNSLAMFADDPWLGVGAGNWKLVSPAYGPMSERMLGGDLFFQRPHNDYLWILAESGPLAFLCYLSVFVSALVFCVQVLRRSRSRDDLTAATALLFGLILYMVIAFFSYPKERMVHTMLVSLMLAASLSLYGRTVTARVPSRIRGQAVLTVVAILLAVPALLVGLVRLEAEFHTKRMLTARAQGDWTSVVRETDLASSRWIQIDHTATPLAWHRGVANYTLGNHDTAFSDFKSALKVHPNHLHVLNNLATCYEQKGMHDSAEYYYRRALQIVPGFEETIINLAAVLYNAERYQEALRTLETIDPPINDSRYELYLDHIRQKIDSLFPGQ